MKDMSMCQPMPLPEPETVAHSINTNSQGSFVQAGVFRGGSNSELPSEVDLDMAAIMVHSLSPLADPVT